LAIAFWVSAEGQGVSKIVSVKFHKTGEPATATGTTPLETPTPTSVDAAEDAPHKREETLEIAATK